MAGHKFEYGPISRGVYLATWSVAVVIALYFPDYFFYYMFVLLLVGIGLRPLIEKTGLYELYQSLAITLEEKWHKKYVEKRRAELDRKARDQKYRNSRVKDSRLPRNW